MVGGTEKEMVSEDDETRIYKKQYIKAE